MSQVQDPLLDFQKVTVRKGGQRKVLNSVSLQIYAGENVAILGPNGSGKSSFIKVITREYYPVAGERGSSCRILGQDRWNVSELRYLLGIVSNELQDACNRDITGLEMVLSGFFSSIGLDKVRLTTRMKKKADQVISLLEVYGLRDRKMNAMSTGEARRFLIGRALVHDPKALILDEPMNGLDMHANFNLSAILRKIARSGTSIILVTHNLSEIIPEIKRVVFMKEGRFYKDGVKEKVLTDSNISHIFGVKVEVQVKDGYYYALRG